MEGLQLSFSKVVGYVRVWRATEHTCVNLCKAILHFVGSWPDPDAPRGLASVVRFIFPRIALYSSVYGVIIGHPLIAYESFGTDIHLAVESLSATFLALMVCSVLIGLLYRGNQLDRLFRALAVMDECSSKLAERPSHILGRTKRIGELLAFFLVCAMAVLVCSLLPLPLLVMKRKFLFIHWYPFNPKASPAYEIIFACTTAAHMAAMSTLVAFHVALIALLVEASGQFSLLQHNLRAACDGDPRGVAQECRLVPVDGLVIRERHGEVVEQDARDKIKACVQLHYAITSFVQEVDSTFNVYLALFMTCTLVPSGMCILLMFYAEDYGTKTVTYIFMIGSSNLGTALCCWLGNDLTDQNEAIRDAAYDSEWFGQSEGFKRSMRIIMSRCNRPMVIQAGGFVPLSMETYYSMTKLTYSYIMAMWSYFQQSSDV